MNIPVDRRYTETHEWVRLDGNSATIGITSHAVEELNDLTFLSLPEVGAGVTAGEEFGEIESVKAVGSLKSPVTKAGPGTSWRDSTRRASWTAWQSRTVAAPAATHSAGQSPSHGAVALSLPEARWVEKTSRGPTGWSVRVKSTVRNPR